MVVTSHVDDILSMKDRLIRTALEECGLRAEAYAKAELSTPKPHGRPNKAGQMTYPNIDTGNLRNSITHRVVMQGDESQMHVGTNVDYGIHVELGTHKSRAYPYVRPAVRDHLNEYSQIIQNTLR